MPRTEKPLVRTKEFPSDYPEDAVAILSAMALGDKLNIVGSMSLRAQQYAGDYDGYEVVNLKEPTDAAAAAEARRRFQAAVKELRAMPDVYIGDIKAGVVPEWRVIPRDAAVEDGKIVGFNATESRRKIDEILAAKVITKKEADEAHDLIKGKMTIPRFLKAKNKIKFHIVRWTVPEVLENKKVLRDGRTMTLDEAFQTPIIAKMDVIGLVQRNRFTDFSVIYEIRNKGKTLNPDKIEIGKSLREAIVAYEAEGNHFKVLKRRFALAKFEHDLPTIEKLTPILNSDLGRLYHITGDIGTLLGLLERKEAPLEAIRYEIDQFRNRLANIYTMSDYLAAENDVIGQIDRLVRLPKTKLPAALEKLGDQLEGYLQSNTKKIMAGKLKGGVLPLLATALRFLPMLLGNGRHRGGNRFIELTEEELAHQLTLLNAELNVMMNNPSLYNPATDTFVPAAAARAKEIRKAGDDIFEAQETLRQKNAESAHSVLDEPFEKVIFGPRRRRVGGVIPRDVFEARKLRMPNYYPAGYTYDDLLRDEAKSEEDYRRMRAELDAQNAAYMEAVARGEIEEEVACVLDDKLEYNRDTVPKSVCAARHDARRRKDMTPAQRTFDDINKGLSKVADWGVENILDKVPVVGQIVGETYKEFAPPTSKFYKPMSEKGIGERITDTTIGVLDRQNKKDDKKDDKKGGGLSADYLRTRSVVELRVLLRELSGEAAALRNRAAELEAALSVRAPPASSPFARAATAARAPRAAELEAIQYRLSDLEGDIRALKKRLGYGTKV